MLRRLQVAGFKSIQSAELRLPRLTVLFGANAAGKSNFLDAIQVLSRLGTERTLSDALSDPVRGHTIESFGFPPGGLSSLLAQGEASFLLDADLSIGKELYEYRVRVSIQTQSGSLAVADECLVPLKPKSSPRIEHVDGHLSIRRKSKPGHPRQEPIGLNHTILSDPRLGGSEYRPIEKCRDELTGWRVYYLDPRVAMRSAKSPAEVTDIGVLGENIAPFLYRLRAEAPRNFDAIRRTLRSIVPSIQDLQVDLDTRRGTLDVLIRQDGRDFSSRIVSEGTLRVLALCCIVANPWGGTLVAFEEPENGVHPRRLELIAELLISLAVSQQRQVIVTTHSPLFCEAVLRKGRNALSEIALVNVRQTPNGTEMAPFDTSAPLFQEDEILKALASRAEDGVFEALMLRGLLDG